MKHSDESVELHLLARYHKCFPYKVKHSHRLLSSLVEERSTSVTFLDTCLKEISIPKLASHEYVGFRNTTIGGGFGFGRDCSLPRRHKR